MSAEIGSTSCLFPHSEAIDRYLKATGRDYIAQAANHNSNLVRADQDSEGFYDEVIEIDLSNLEPHINGPFTPDLSHPLTEFATNVKDSKWPQTISHAMVGSCTNSSYEDLHKAVNIVRQANKVGLKPKVPLFVTAGSEKIHATVAAENVMKDFETAGATILSNSCGPCVGQWNRTEVPKVFRSSL